MPRDAEYCETGDDHKGHATNQTVPKTFASEIGAHESNFLVAYHANVELIGRRFGGRIIGSKLCRPTPCLSMSAQVLSPNSSSLRTCRSRSNAQIPQREWQFFLAVEISPSQTPTNFSGKCSVAVVPLSGLADKEMHEPVAGHWSEHGWCRKPNPQ
jgi:hypothetical protein